MPKYGKNERGLYETSRTVNGKRIKFRGKTCAEVDRKILEFDAQRKNGRKFPVIADEWIETHSKEVSYSTARNYQFSVNRLKQRFTCHVGEITARDVQQYIADYSAKGFAKQTVQLEVSVLKQIFSYAVIAGDIAQSPAAECRIRRGLPVKKRAALTVEEERLVENYRGEMWLFGLMLLYTGCRRGELLALTWQDIDRGAGVIHITKKLNYSYGNTPQLENNLKSENGKRDIPLLDALDAALPRNRVGLIFHDNNGNFIKLSTLTLWWKRYCASVGLSPSITPHCFRHSFATICYEAGLDAKETAALLGDTEQVARGIYIELRKSKQATCADKVNAYLAIRGEDQMAAEC